jgi:hypothetical protein
MDEGTGTANALRLDGNAAAGLLGEVFVRDVTTARSTCNGCGAVESVGALHLYAHEMGAVLRCPGCDSVVLRVARTTTDFWLDASGARSIAIPTRTVT